jgi:hypothetical protein
MSEGYTERWRKNTVRPLAAGLWFVLGLPAILGIAAALLFATGAGAVVGGAVLVLFLLWLAVLAPLVLRVTRFRCPRCGNLYFSHKELYIGAGRRCGNCQLALYAEH